MLHRGRVIEEGRHDELMAARGRYAEMFQLQADAYVASAAADAATVALAHAESGEGTSASHCMP